MNYLLFLAYDLHLILVEENMTGKILFFYLFAGILILNIINSSSFKICLIIYLHLSNNAEKTLNTFFEKENGKGNGWRNRL